MKKLTLLILLFPFLVIAQQRELVPYTPDPGPVMVISTLTYFNAETNNFEVPDGFTTFRFVDGEQKREANFDGTDWNYSNLSGNVRYISPMGNDAGDGSIGSPWFSVGFAVSPERMSAGDVLFVRDGTYYYDDRQRITVSGTEGNPITIINYPGEKPVFDWWDYDLSHDPNASGEMVGIWGSSIDYITIMGIHLRRVWKISHEGSGGRAYSIYMRWGGHIHLERMIVDSIAGRGIMGWRVTGPLNLINSDIFMIADMSEYDPGNAGTGLRWNNEEVEFSNDTTRVWGTRFWSCADQSIGGLYGNVAYFENNWVFGQGFHQDGVTSMNRGSLYDTWEAGVTYNIGDTIRTRGPGTRTTLAYLYEPTQNGVTDIQPNITEGWEAYWEFSPHPDNYWAGDGHGVKPGLSTLSWPKTPLYIQNNLILYNRNTGFNTNISDGYKPNIRFYNNLIYGNGRWGIWVNPHQLTRFRDEWDDEETYLAGDTVYISAGITSGLNLDTGDELADLMWNRQTVRYFIAKEGGVPLGIEPNVHPEWGDYWEWIPRWHSEDRKFYMHNNISFNNGVLSPDNHSNTYDMYRNRGHIDSYSHNTWSCPFNEYTNPGSSDPSCLGYASTTYWYWSPTEIRPTSSTSEWVGPDATVGDHQFIAVPDQATNFTLMTQPRKPCGSLPDIGDYWQLAPDSDFINAGTSDIPDYTLSYYGDNPDLGPFQYVASGVTTYALTTSVIGSGTITRNPNQGSYDENESVTLTANPSNGWEFTSWSGDLSGSTNPETLIMNSAKNVTATFTELSPTPPIEDLINTWVGYNYYPLFGTITTTQLINTYNTYWTNLTENYLVLKNIAEVLTGTTLNWNDDVITPLDFSMRGVHIRNTINDNNYIIFSNMETLYPVILGLPLITSITGYQDFERSVLISGSQQAFITNFNWNINILGTNVNAMFNEIVNNYGN